jgi:hypothetical protein
VLGPLLGPTVEQNVRLKPLWCRYIRDMGSEMAKMANDASLDLLAYLLSLVVLEANSLNVSELAADPEDPSLQD